MKRAIIAGLSFGLLTGIIQSCGGCASRIVRDKVIIHDFAAPQTTFDCNESYSSECQDLLHNVVPRQRIYEVQMRRSHQHHGRW